MKSFVIVGLAVLTLAACGTEDAQRTKVKEELSAFQAKCGKNIKMYQGTDKECLDAKANEQGGH